MSRGPCRDKAVPRKVVPKARRPLCVRAFTCIPSPVLSCLWDSPGCPSLALPPAPTIPDISDYAALVRSKYGIDPAMVPAKYYQRAVREASDDMAGAGMYPQWLTEIEAVSKTIGKTVYYCAQPELYGARVVWMGLPCRARQILPEAVGQPDHPLYIGKAMVGVVRLDREAATSSGCDDEYAWVVSLACGRVARLGDKEIRVILQTDLTLPFHMRRQTIHRTLPTGGKVEIPYMPAYLYSPKRVGNLAPEIKVRDREREREMTGPCMRIENLRSYKLQLSGLKLGEPLDAQLQAKIAESSQGSTSKKPAPKTKALPKAAPKSKVKIEPPPAKKRRVEGPRHKDTHDKITAVIEKSWDKKLKAAGGDASAVDIPNVIMDLSPQCVPDAEKASVEKQWREAFIAFMRYYHHFFQHVPKVQELLHDVPCDGDYARIMKDPAMPTSMRILYSAFYVEPPK